MNKHWPKRKTKHGKKKRVNRSTPNLGLEPISFYRKEDTKVRKFWELLKSSIIVQGLVTLAFTCTICYLYATGQEVPNTLIQFGGVIVGYFFGVKQQYITGRAK